MRVTDRKDCTGSQLKKNPIGFWAGSLGYSVTMYEDGRCKADFRVWTLSGGGGGCGVGGVVWCGVVLVLVWSLRGWWQQVPYKRKSPQREEEA